MQYYDYIKLPLDGFPYILAFADDTGLTTIQFKEDTEFLPLLSEHRPEKFRDLRLQLQDYITGKLEKFDLELNIQGTKYQKKIWGLLQEIPYGITISYKILAEKANSSPRAIGGANRLNPLPIIIPCHRVISHNDTLGGYMGYGENSNHNALKLKQYLIDLEAIFQHILIECG